MDDAPALRPRYWLHALLFLATLVTTTVAGLTYSAGLWLAGLPPDAPAGALLARIPAALPSALAFSLPLMGILAAHEMGHYVAARIHGVRASLPYFIPLPPPFPLGTMGAIITMRGMTRSRDKLVDVGAAGPLAGLVVAIPVLVVGLVLSEVRPTTALPGQLVTEGNSLLYLLLKRAVHGEWLPGGGRDVFLSPTAYAGWAGLFVTMLNLIPIGQLDGGHVAVGYFGNAYERAAGLLHRAMPFVGLATMTWVGLRVRAAGVPDAGMIGLSAGLPWVVWALVLGGLRRLSGGTYHPAVDDPPLSPGRRWLCRGVLVVFALIFTPYFMI
jgi:membrane-associated protease RseP (regulator of RpoE activity)